MTYRIKDSKTGVRANKTVYRSLKSAHRAADKMDNAYGAYRYVVVHSLPAAA